MFGDLSYKNSSYGVCSVGDYVSKFNPSTKSMPASKFPAANQCISPEEQATSNGLWGTNQPNDFSNKSKNMGLPVANPTDPAITLAEKQYKSFVSKSYNWPNFVTNNAWNVGKFDFKYNPSAKSANVTMKVKFLYPDVKGKTKKDNALRRAKSKGFITSVQNMWSNKFQFMNIREPGNIWKRLNPVSVNLKVIEDDKNPHFSINMYQNKTGRAAVNADHTVDLYKGDYAPVKAFPNTPKGETKRAKAAGAKNIFFENNSSLISAKYSSQLVNFANYLKRINQPKFKVYLEGHASTSGKSDYNLKLSKERLANVEQKLKSSGLNNHTYVTNFVGESAGISGDKGRKVVVKAIADKNYVNYQDVTPHEFGHMLGLDDEYVYSTAGNKLDHYGLVEKAFGKHYAEQVGRQDDTDSASLMNGGDQLRIHHYVTIWDALVQTTLSKATLPTPRFGYKDWKFVE